jgi:hypothetical protein
MAPSSPRRFWTPVRAGLASLALALPALTLQLFVSACGQSDGGDSAGSGGGAGSVEPIGTTGVGGVESDATVPDGQPDVTPPTFAELCGDGDCVPGTPDECGVSADFAVQGCQVTRRGDEPYPDCFLAGEGEHDAPCQTGADCIPGDTCVPTEGSENEGYAGVCRPYCCGDVESCPLQSFCAPRPLVGEDDLDVPVCVPVAPCELLSEGACPDGKTCGVVRTDGTTSCVVAGTGALCEECPCADGLICAQNTNRCQKLCHTEGADDECGAGVCQGGSADYPPGFGVCIGGENACSR